MAFLGRAPSIESYNTEHDADIEICQMKFLNNIVEQDHQAIKRITRPTLCFKSLWPAVITIAGIGIMHMFHKGQLRLTGSCFQRSSSTPSQDSPVHRSQDHLIGVKIYNRTEAAALTGLASITSQSGQEKVESGLIEGRSASGRALYMPTLVAMHFSFEFKCFYDRFVCQRKSSKLAIIAVVRKLVILSDVLLRDDRSWTSKAV